MTNPVSAPLIYKSSITLTCLLKDLPAVSLTCRYSRSWLYHQSSQEGKGLSCDGNLTPIVTTNSLPQEICFLFLQISANQQTQMTSHGPKLPIPFQACPFAHPALKKSPAFCFCKVELSLHWTFFSMKYLSPKKILLSSSIWLCLSLTQGVEQFVRGDREICLMNGSKYE